MSNHIGKNIIQGSASKPSLTNTISDQQVLQCNEKTV